MKGFIEQTLVPWLKWALDPFHAWLDGLPPAAWRASICAFLILGTCWVLFLRREFVFRGAADQRLWRDLRVWVILLLIPYLAIYLLF